MQTANLVGVCASVTVPGSTETAKPSPRCSKFEQRHFYFYYLYSRWWPTNYVRRKNERTCFSRWLHGNTSLNCGSVTNKATWLWTRSAFCWGCVSGHWAPPVMQPSSQLPFSHSPFVQSHIYLPALNKEEDLFSLLHVLTGVGNNFFYSWGKVKFSELRPPPVFCVNPFVGKRTELIFHPNSVFEMYLLRTSMFGMKLFAFCSDMDLFHVNPFSCSLQTLLFWVRTLDIMILLTLLLSPRTISCQCFQESRKANWGEGQFM